MKLLVVFDQLNNHELEQYRSADTEILNLSDLPNETFSKSISFLDRSELLLKHQPKVVELFKNLIGKMGNKKIYQGKNIKQILAVPEGVSLWWFNDLQYKFYREYLLCNWLVYCEIIKELIASNKYDQCIVFGGQAPFLNAIKELISDPRLSFHHKVSYSPKNELLIAISRVLHTFFYAFFTLWQAITIRLLYKPANRSPQRPDVTFFSIYPGSLVCSNNKLKDRYYGQLPKDLKSKGLSINFLSFLDRKMGFENLFSINYLRHAAAADYNISFLESFLSFFEIVNKFVVYLKIALKILLLPRQAKQSLCTIDGIDYSALFLEPFLTSIYSYQNYQSLLLMDAAYKYSKQFQPKLLFSCYVINHVGRAINCGIRRFSKDIPIVGMQHASYPRTKLETRYHKSEIDPNKGGRDLINYAPFADYELFQGKITKELFNEAGLPEERSLLLGSPRFDSLFQFATNAENLRPNVSCKTDKIPKGKKVLLVATGLFEADIKQLLDVLFQAVDDNFFLLFKPHPNKPIEGMLKKYARIYPQIGYQICSGNIYELLLIADVLITTHSTVAEEAIALGKPAISVHAGTHLNVGALASLGLDVCAHNPQELKEKINKYLCLDKDNFARMRQYVIEQCFGFLDGKATERVVDFIVQRINNASKKEEVSL